MQVRLRDSVSVQVQALAEREQRSVSQMASILVAEALTFRITGENDRALAEPGAASRSGDPHPGSANALVQATVPEAGKVFRGPDPR